MGFCTNCGRPCSACSGEAGEFGLLSLPKLCRHLVTVVLKKMNRNNETDQGILVEGLKPYKDKPEIINNALKEYLVLRDPPRSIPYIIGMVKNKAINSNRRRLDAVPPLAKGYEDDG